MNDWHLVKSNNSHNSLEQFNSSTTRPAVFFYVMLIICFCYFLLPGNNHMRLTSTALFYYLYIALAVSFHSKGFLLLHDKMWMWYCFLNFILSLFPGWWLHMPQLMSFMCISFICPARSWAHFDVMRHMKRVLSHTCNISPFALSLSLNSNTNILWENVKQL